MSIGDRILLRLDAVGMSQSELARRVGVKQPTINNIIHRNKTGTVHLHKIARELKTTQEYLSGEIDDHTEGAVAVPTAETLADQIDAVMVPMVDLSFSMGGGSVLDEGAIIGEYPFPRAWLKARCAGSVDQVRLFVGEGDSMQPTIYSGDQLLVDLAQKTMRQADQIWAIAVRDTGMVKRLRRAKGGGYVILSDNDRVPPDLADDGEMEIVGKVIGIFRWQ